MEYIISEEELIDYTSKVKEDNGKSLIGTLYKDFLKSKQPIELVAEIKPVNKVTKLLDIAARIDSVTKEIYYNLDIGNNIKIYIQKAK